MIHMHWKLLGKLAVPCRDLMEWAHWFETANRHVAQTEVGPMLGIREGSLLDGDELRRIWRERAWPLMRTTPRTLKCEGSLRD